jgi:DNA polymerase-3 subunit delta'
MNAELASSSPLLGHDEALRQAVAAFDAGRMHHAWLIAGIEGIGKATLARQIATHVFSSVQNPLGRPDLRHRIEKSVAGEAHPDCLILRRAADEKTGELRKVIVVDDALKVGAFLRRTATHGGWRVVIIDEAHTLNRHAQNATLKILEEPPSQALILMTATTPGALLPTIRSRCRVLHLSPLDTAHLRSVLMRAQPDLPDPELERLIALSGGSAGFALQILRSEALPLYDELAALLEESGAAIDVARLHRLADQMSRKADSESFEVVTTLLLERLRGAIRDAALAGRDHARLEARLRQWDKVRGILAASEISNLDRKLALINAAAELHGAL